ncbi:MAG: phosphotransferase [Pseudomonadota bacterium]|nr:phosphotransferase [Pseudomonadota bacterium]
MTDDEALALARDAAAAWGATGTPTLIRNRENAVFRIALPSGPAALRLHRLGYQTAAAIRSELWMCEAMAQIGAPVPQAVRTLGGDLLHPLPGGRLSSVIGWIDGVVIGEGGVPLPGDAPAQAGLHRRLGATLAQVHRAADALDLPPGIERHRWNRAGLLGETPLWGPFWDHPLLDQAERRRMAAIRAECDARLATYEDQRPDVGFIHADVLRENVLEGHAMTLIDFDDSGFGFRLYDLGTALSQNLTEPNGAAIRDALIEGYGTLTPVDIAMLDVFTLLRCLASVGWTAGRLPPGDPRHAAYIRRAFLAAERAL